ncbi:single-stranded DNA-binding protein, partial [Clostridium sp.]|uniref:single-stranded DNA-binding protein n=1 Tax=Clostridium sp. TaxID=1506 RepID=UPI00261ACBE0
NEYKHKDKDNNAVFINIIAFGKQAEVLNKYVTKGSKLAIEGRINTDNYLDSKGEKKYSFIVTLEEFYFLDSKKEHIS